MMNWTQNHLNLLHPNSHYANPYLLTPQSLRTPIGHGRTRHHQCPRDSRPPTPKPLSPLAPRSRLLKPHQNPRQNMGKPRMNRAQIRAAKVSLTSLERWEPAGWTGGRVLESLPLPRVWAMRPLRATAGGTWERRSRARTVLCGWECCTARDAVLRGRKNTCLYLRDFKSLLPQKSAIAVLKNVTRINCIFLVENYN
jgi:hypothetical protein